MVNAQDDKPTLYLIDGHAQMFRAFFAIGKGRSGSMTSPVTGEPTGALFAFTGMLIKLFRDSRPQYAAMVVDSKEKTFRHEMYDDYKANRDEAPEDFLVQIPRMFELAKLFGLPILEKPGYEADDIMATIATMVAEDQFANEADDLQLKLVSKDKDLEQVLGERVVLYDVQTDETINVDRMREKRGISPQQAIDYQTLTGDSTDNIPGVKGIGPKTAVKLLKQFGSVENLLANTDKLKGKQKERVEQAAANGDIELSRKLVTLATDTPIEFELDQTRADGLSRIDGPALLALFDELGFTRHVADLRALLDMPEQKLAVPTPPTKSTSRSDGDDNDQPIGLFAAGAADDDSSSSATDHASGGGADAADNPASAADHPQAATSPATAAYERGDYRLIATASELDALVSVLPKQSAIAVDTETVGLGRTAALAGVCLSWEVGKAVYVPTLSPEPNRHLDTAAVVAGLKPVLEDPSIGKFGHHLKYDIHVLSHAGIELAGVQLDSMIAAFLCNAPGRGMDDLAMAELGHRCLPLTSLIGPKPRRKSDPPQKTIDQVPLDLVAAYAAEDADITLQLCKVFEKRLAELGMDKLAADIEMPLVSVLAWMERMGIACDPEVLDQQKATLQTRIDELRSQLLDAARADFNPDSPKQLAEVLFTQLGFPTVRKTRTGESTDVQVMETLAERATNGELSDVPEHAHVIPSLMLEYRMLTKLVGTYLGNLKDAIDPADGRIHTSFVQTGAATGRLASNDPNLQNIPIRTDVGRDIRKAFVAPPGRVLLSADYSQIELRVLAHLSEDAGLIEAFERGDDIHTAVAAQVFDVAPEDVTRQQRTGAKTINFGIIYGVTPFGLSRRIEGLSVEDAAKLIDDYKKRFPGIDRFLQQCIDQANELGYVTTMFGRRRWIDLMDSKRRDRRQLGERLAINSVVQGSAADLIKLAMVQLDVCVPQHSPTTDMLVQVHDELLYELDEPNLENDSRLIEHTMTQVATLRVPLSVNMAAGRTWFDCK